MQFYNPDDQSFETDLNEVKRLWCEPEILWL